MPPSNLALDRPAPLRFRLPAELGVWPRVRASLPAAAASLAVHGALLLLLAWWVDPRSPVLDDQAPIVTLTLHSPVDVAARARPADPVESQAPTPVIEAPPEPAIDAEADAAALEPPALPSEPTAIAAPSDPAATTAAETPPEIDIHRLRAQLPGLWGQPEADPDADDEAAAWPGGAPLDRGLPWARRGDAVRGLPLGGGWMNPWVGPVEARSETWGSAIGEQRGVHVLPNGQIICTRVEAPSVDELMNPWMAMRVTYVRLCGKARGTAPPPDDLDYAPAPSRIREAGSR